MGGTSLVMLIVLMSGFYINEKNLLDAVLYLDIAKRSVFKTNCDKQWKVDTVQWGGMEEIVGQESWSTTSQTPVFIQRKWCCIYGGIGKQLSNKSSLWGTKWLISINIATN